LTKAAAIKPIAVLDASAALAWFFADERDEKSVAMANAVAQGGAVVPAIFRWEIQSALLVAVKRKRMTDDEIETALRALDDLPLQVDEVILKEPLNTGLGFAQRFGLTAYDAAYLELAVRSTLPLMTLDLKLRAVAADLKIEW